MKPSELLKNLNEISQDITTTISHATPNSLPHLEQLLDAIDAAADLIEGLIPRPIEEAPMDKYFITMNDSLVKIGLYNSRLNRVLSDNSIYLTEAKSFIPLSAIQKLMESGE